MTIQIPVNGTAAYQATYKDAAGNLTSAPADVVLTWTLSDPTVASLDTTSGPSVVITATGAIGAASGLSVSDGTFTSVVENIVIVAGAPASLEIAPA